MGSPNPDLSGSTKTQLCSPNIWSTIFMGPIPLIGLVYIYAWDAKSQASGAIPDYDYSLKSLYFEATQDGRATASNQTYHRSGVTSGPYYEKRLWMGPTQYALVRVNPKRLTYFQVKVT